MGGLVDVMDHFTDHLYDNNLNRLALAADIIPDRFVLNACSLSRQIGTPVKEKQLKKILLLPRMKERQTFPEDMTGWFPGRINWKSGKPFVEWVYLGDHNLGDVPFFEDMVRRHGRYPINQLLGFTTPLDLLSQLEIPDPVLPAGFIFHVSRCGSTLVSQMLGAVEGNRVLSDPPPIDTVLRSRFQDPSITTDQQIQWLKNLVKVFGHRRSPTGRRLFIKLDCWHIQALPLVHKAFPKVPILFLFRDPIEVLVSHRHRSGIHMVPGLIQPEWFGSSPAEIREMTMDVYRVWVLEKFFKAAHEYAGTVKFTTINYNQLPAAVWSDDINPFGRIFHARDIKKMEAASRYSSKDPVHKFNEDSEEKQRSAGGALRSLVKEHLRETYDAFLTTVSPTG